MQPFHTIDASEMCVEVILSQGFILTCAQTHTHTQTSYSHGMHISESVAESDANHRIHRWPSFFQECPKRVLKWIQYDSLKMNKDGWLFPGPGVINLSGMSADMNLGGFHHKLPPEWGKTISAMKHWDFCWCLQGYELATFKFRISRSWEKLVKRAKH